MASIKLTPSEKYAKALVRLMVHKAGSNRSAAELTGIQESELSRYGSDDVDRHISFSRAIEMDEVFGDVMLRAWMRRRGYEAVSTEQRAELSLSVDKLIARLHHAAADFTGTVIEVREDGKSTPNEMKKAESDAAELIVTAENLVKAVGQLRVV